MPYRLRSVEDILRPLAEASALSKYTRGKITRVPFHLDVINMVDAMQRLAGNRLAEEMVFVNDEGSSLYLDYPGLDGMLEIAVNGQGDSWLMDVSCGEICFFDHNDGNIVRLGIDFWQFLQLADLIGQWERSDGAAGVYEAMRLIAEDLPEKYPFAL